MLVLFNLSAMQQTFDLKALRLSSTLDGHGLLSGMQDKQHPATIVLPSYASFYGLLAK
jgi:alpha-glucosidase